MREDQSYRVGMCDAVLDSVMVYEVNSLRIDAALRRCMER